jgi:hypothetical protein
LETGAVFKREMTCAVGDLKRSCVNHRHRIRKLHCTMRIKTSMFRKPTLPAKHGNPITYGESAHSFPQRIDDARHLHTQHKWKFGSILIRAFDHQKVSKIQTTRMDSHPNLTGFWGWNGDIGDCWCDIVTLDLKRLQLALLQ